MSLYCSHNRIPLTSGLIYFPPPEVSVGSGTLAMESSLYRHKHMYKVSPSGYTTCPQCAGRAPFLYICSFWQRYISSVTGHEVVRMIENQYCPGCAEKELGVNSSLPNNRPRCLRAGHCMISKDCEWVNLECSECPVVKETLNLRMPDKEDVVL